MPRAYTDVHPKVKIDEQILENLYRVQFHTSSRAEAIDKHLAGELLPQEAPVEIWTDGSLTPGENAGAAALYIDNRTDPPTEEVRETALSSIIVQSSYETELIALGCGLDTAAEQDVKDTKVHIFSDSLSWIKQLQALPTRPKRVHDEVAACADKLAQLVANNNEVHVHFIPSHVPLPKDEPAPSSKMESETTDDTEAQSDCGSTQDLSPVRKQNHNREPPVENRKDLSEADGEKMNDCTNSQPLYLTLKEIQNQTPPSPTNYDHTDTDSSSENLIPAYVDKTHPIQIEPSEPNDSDCSSDDDSDSDSATPRRRKFLEIGHSEEIDKLAKRAAKKGICGVEHSPFISSYKLHLRRMAADRLEDHLKNNIKESKWEDYPNRQRYRDDAKNIAYDSRKIHTHPLLNRARSGHCGARQHLYNISQDLAGESSQCRHCGNAAETIEHQLLHCTALHHKLQQERDAYARLWKNSFTEALWKYEDEMTNILKSAKNKKCLYI